MHNNYVRGIKYRLLFATAIGGAAIVAACSSPGPMSPAVSEIRFSTVAPDTQPSATPTPYAFKFTTLDDPHSTSYTRIYGLDDLAQVVGVTKINGGNDTSGFTSSAPYESYDGVVYPGATSTAVTSVNPAGRVLAGYFVKDGSTWGFIRDRGLWTEYRDGDTPKGEGSVNKLMGINDNAIAVGFYADTQKRDHAYELADRRFVNIVPPNSVNVVAASVTLAGNVAGTATLKNGSVEGWLLRSGNYTLVTYPGASKTEINGMSDGLSSNLLVGSYSNAKGTHGFILRSAGGNAVWQSVDEPNAKNFTVITGMNNHHVICGWYVDAAGHNHGFVGTVPE
jgi:hypothetical protein